MRLRSGSPWANIVPKISAQIASDDKGYWVVIKTGFTLGHCSAAITVHIVSIEHFSYFLGNSTQIRLLKLHTLIKSLYIDWSVWIKVNILFYVYL